MNRQSLPITIVSCLLIVIGCVGIVRHFYEEIPAVLSGILAASAGVMMLLRLGWARWLAVVWLVFHVVLGALHSPMKLIVHAFLLAVISFLIFRPAAAAYFKRPHK